MRDEPINNGVELFSSEPRTAAEPLIIEPTLSLELGRMVILLAIFLGLLILRFS